MVELLYHQTYLKQSSSMDFYVVGNSHFVWGNRERRGGREQLKGNFSLILTFNIE